MRRAADCPCSARRSCFRVLESRLECPLSRLVIGCLEHPACRLVASGLECAASWTRRRCQCSSLPRGGLSPRQSALVSHSRDHCVDARPPVCAAGTPLTRLAQRHRLHECACVSARSKVRRPGWCMQRRISLRLSTALALLSACRYGAGSDLCCEIRSAAQPVAGECC
eukprot:365095-Chlamydomonas_euryale.AAC.11